MTSLMTYVSCEAAGECFNLARYELSFGWYKLAVTCKNIFFFALSREKMIRNFQSTFFYYSFVFFFVCMFDFFFLILNRWRFAF